MDADGGAPVDRSSSLLISRSISSNSSSRMLGMRWRSITLELEDADQSRSDADCGEKRTGGVRSTLFGTPVDEAIDVQRDSGVDDAPDGRICSFSLPSKDDIRALAIPCGIRSRDLVLECL